MPRKAPDVPPYRVHKAKGLGYVNLNGRRVYLGHDSSESKQRYARIIAEWIVGGRQPIHKPTDLRIIELTSRFWSYIETRYPQRTGQGNPKGEAWAYHRSMIPLNELYGDTVAAEFGPLRLKAVRERYLADGLTREGVNRRVECIKRLFRWAVGNELVPSATLHGLLEAVPGLRRGESTARETDPVKPVPEENVEETLKHCTPTLAAMIRLQLLTGMRPGEVCNMQTAHLNTSGKVWTYTPPKHKTAYRGRVRTVYLGRRAQAVLTPFLKADLHAYIFSPAQSDRERRDRQHDERVTPLSCGNKPGSNVKRHPMKTPGERYDTNAYRNAIEYACLKAWPIPKGLDAEAVKSWKREHRWHPNQLRHTFATRVRREHGLEAAQVLLGHAMADVTQVYAERDEAKAVGVVAMIG